MKKRGGDPEIAIGLVLGRWANPRFRDREDYPKDHDEKIGVGVARAVLAGVLTIQTEPEASKDPRCGHWGAWSEIAILHDAVDLLSSQENPSAADFLHRLMTVARKEQQTNRQTLESATREFFADATFPSKHLRHRGYTQLGLEILNHFDSAVDESELQRTRIDLPDYSALGVAGYQTRRIDMPDKRGFEKHFDEPTKLLEVFAHNFMHTTDQELMLRLTEFLERGNSQLYISLLDPMNKAMYDAYLTSRHRNKGQAFEEIVPAHKRALEALDRLQQVHSALEEDQARRFAIATHDNLFGTMIFKDRHQPQRGSAQIEYLFADLKARNFTSINLTFAEDPESTYQVHSRLADRLKDRGTIRTSE